MTLPTIDTHNFEALQANVGADFVVTLVEAFAEEGPRLLAELRQAQAAADADRVETLAHTLKSNGVAFGATLLAEAARRLEWQGPSAGVAAIDELAAELEAALAALRNLSQRP